MRIRTNYIIIAAALLAVHGCNNKAEVVQGGDFVEVKVNAGISTKAVDNMWEEGDAIGITMFDQGTANPSKPEYVNSKYVTGAGEIGSFVSSNPSTTLYFPPDGRKVDFISYYPFVESMPEDYVMPLSVTDQRDQRMIDFMTAVHLEGDSRDNSDVSMRFYHRMSMLIFDIVGEEGFGDERLSGCKILIDGMATKGTYDLVAKAGAKSDPASIAQIEANYDFGLFPQATVLPRTAGEGVVFTIALADGNSYRAAMNSEMELLEGYKYTFHITVHNTEVSMRVDIEPWIDGGDITADAVAVTTTAGESYGAVEGDVLTVYADGVFFADYVFGDDGRWATTNPLAKWEYLEGETVTFRSTLKPRADALNGTQLPDIITSDEVTVQRNQGVGFTLSHRLSKVYVNLHSSDGSFTAGELEGAAIVLPGYLTGGTVDNGLFLPGDKAGDILLSCGEAIFQPQTIAAGRTLAKVTIAGRDYYVECPEGGVDYKAGEFRTITIDIRKTGLSLSVRILPWVDGGDITADALAITTIATDSEGVIVGDKMDLYVNGTFFALYTYGADGKWTTSNPLARWEYIAPNPSDFRAYIHPRATAMNDSQLPDYLISDEISVGRNNAINLTVRHIATKVNVVLASSDNSFSAAELAGATIVLPDYLNGGLIKDGLFIPGTTIGNILLEECQAIFQPQTIAAGETLVKITINGRDYFVETPAGGITYGAGEQREIRINMLKTQLSISTKLTDWTTASTLNYETRFVTPVSPGTSSGFVADDQITLFILNNDNESADFIYGSDGKWGTVTPIWWDDLDNIPAEVSGVFATSDVTPTGKVITWAVDVDQNAEGLSDQDLMLAYVSSVDAGEPAELTFSHVLSKVIVNIIPGTGFTAGELNSAEVYIENMPVTASVNLATMLSSGFGAASNDIKAKLFTSPKRQYEAILFPYSVSSGSTLLTVKFDGYDYPVVTPSTFQFESKKVHTLNVTVNKTEITISATVEEWTPGNNGDYIID